MATLLLLAANGCMSTDRALRDTERIGNRLAGDYRTQITGQTNDFSVLRPADRLRNRLMLAQQLPGNVSTNLADLDLPDPLVLSLTDALMVGARNDSRYQEMKESIFTSALDLDLQRHAFENTFAGILQGGVTRDLNGDSGSGQTQADGAAKATVGRTFANGMNLAASLGLDIVRLLTGDRDSAFGLLGDATITIPLMRGAGREIVREPLTQAEKNLRYAIHDFENYRQNYAIRVAAAYYALLESQQQLKSLRDNHQRLSDSYRRAQMMSDAGRMPRIQLDQTRQDLLRTGDQIVTARQRLEAEYDQFKITLGLPADARIEVNMAELTRIEQNMGLDLESDKPVDTRSPPLPWTEEEAIAMALTNRHDLVVIRGKYEDARRAIVLAADQLRADLGLTGSAAYGRRRESGGSWENDKRTLGLRLESDLPWERTDERNQYRKSLLALQAAERAIEAAEDNAKSAVRASLRNLHSAWSSFGIQVEAVRVAQRRVHSTDLFQQAGRAEVRDMLEAESALLSARNALVAAIVRYRLAGLELRRDLSRLDLSEQGTWREL